MNNGIVIRDVSDSRVWGGQRLSSPETETKAQSAFVTQEPGILIFSRRRQLLHMNRRALELTGHLNQSEMGRVNDIREAPPVHELKACIKEALDSREEAYIWELYELKRVIFDAGRKILVRGFKLAGLNSHDDSRIVIVLDEVPSAETLERESDVGRDEATIPVH